MATGDYCTLSELKARVWPDGEEPDTVNDAMLASQIAAVSRLIDRLTGRRFYTTAADETRYYTADHGAVLFCRDDILSITTLSTDADGDGTYEDDWEITDYILCPENASADSEPYTWIEISEQGDYSFPKGVRKGVKIVGKFGFASSTAPKDTMRLVKEACLIQCMRLFKRRDAPFGVVSNPAGGEMRLIEQLDSDVALMLQSVSRLFV